MKTFLDQFVDDIAEAVLLETGANRRERKRLASNSEFKIKALDDFYAGCKTVLDDALRHDSAFNGALPWMGHMLGYLSPTKQKEYGSLATALTTSSVKTLVDGSLNPEAYASAIDTLMKHRVMYVDLPAGAYPLADGSIHVKAIVALAVTVAGSPSFAIALVASLPKRERDHESDYQCLSWREVDKVGTRYNHPDLLCENGQIADYYEDAAAIFKPLEDFLLSTLLYVTEVQKDPAAGIVDLPRRNNRASKAAFSCQHPMIAAEESLFKVSYISSVKRGSSGPRGPEEGKRAPYRRHEVPGFWRRQAYGPGRSLRRRIYINDFERGHGELVPKTSMTKVSAVNSDTLDKVMA